MTDGDEVRIVRGAGVSPGRAAGPTVRMATAAGEPSRRRTTLSEEEATAAISDAATAVAERLSARSEEAEGTAREVLQTTAQIAKDPTLIKDAQKRVRDDRVTPERAVWEAAGAVADQFESLGGYFAERARDVSDVRDRIIAGLLGAPSPGLPHREEPYILLAQDLAPVDTAQLDPQVVRALVTEQGGPTSHTAILARSLGIPAVVGVGAGIDRIATPAEVLVDGGSGKIYLDPTEEQVAAARERPRQRSFEPPGRTQDGHRIALLANVAEVAQAEPAAQAGAEGIGLFRTEFAYLGRDTEPSIEEQAQAYSQVFAAFSGRRVVIRTLDAGADKPLPFLATGEEANPALGVRGIRTSWYEAQVLQNQLTAIARAAQSSDADVWVMAPMISQVSEAEDFVRECAAHGLQTAGVMVEVPSAALLAGPILARAAFASIGTNDLVQYTLAADRLLGSLSMLSTPWDPAVLQLVKATCEGGQAQDRPIGVCGEAAADPVLAPVLVGLGVSSLSMTPRALGDVGAMLAGSTLTQCRQAAGLALSAENADDARESARGALPAVAELGL